MSRSIPKIKILVLITLCLQFSLSQRLLAEQTARPDKPLTLNEAIKIGLANNPEIIRRLGVIAMNTPVEFDIYAHANSTLIGGTRMINGIGGSGDFLRNAFLSIMHSPSVRPSKTDPTGISCVVPMVPHVDHTEHDLDVLVTEQGLADLRGLCPRDRAQVVIDRCAHPDYQPILQDYLDRASADCLARGVGHEPHMLAKVFRMQQHLAEHGTMKVPDWD